MSVAHSWDSSETRDLSWAKKTGPEKGPDRPPKICPDRPPKNVQIGPRNGPGSAPKTSDLADADADRTAGPELDSIILCFAIIWVQKVATKKSDLD